MKLKRLNPDLFKKVWGLTGGIASGKSTVATLFKQQKCNIIDADAIARKLLRKGSSAFLKIKAKFKTTNRAQLRKIVFNDPKARTVLESILHPMIHLESLRQIQSKLKRNPERPILYEAALLIETGKYKMLRGLIVVQCPKAIRKKRLVKRDGISPVLAEKMISAQVTDHERRKLATFLVQNTGNRGELKKEVLKVLGRLSRISPL